MTKIIVITRLESDSFMSGVYHLFFVELFGMRQQFIESLFNFVTFYYMFMQLKHFT